MAELKSTRAAVRQAAALCLGHICYTKCSRLADTVCERLSFQLESLAKVSAHCWAQLIPKADVETRRFAIRSLADIICQTGEDGSLLGMSSECLYTSSDNPHAAVPKVTIAKAIDVFMESLGDYSTDQRGDIGSWIRIIALESLGRTLSSPQMSSILTRAQLDEALGGIIKQSVEKLEPCRAEACKSLQRLRANGIRWSGDDALSFGSSVEK